MRKTVLVLSAGLALCLVGCGSKEEKPGPTPSPSPTASPAASPSPAPTGAGTGGGTQEPSGGHGSGTGGGLKGQNKMANCPNRVENAVTKIEDTKDGVAVSITAKDPKDAKTVDDIRAKAKHMVDLVGKDPAQVEHTGQGGGGGGLGHCPITPKDTKATSEDVDGGVKVTLTPTDPAQLDQLRQTVRDRQTLVEKGQLPGGGP